MGNESVERKIREKVQREKERRGKRESRMKEIE